MAYLFIILVAILFLVTGFFFYWKSRQVEHRAKIQTDEMNRRMYELTILKELGDRIGYSLNIQQIVDIITGSLHQFIEYTAVSYMLLEPENIVFKLHLDRSASRQFVDEIKNRMLNSLSALLEKKFETSQVEETLTGAILVEELKEPVRSFFNIPLVIGQKAVGVLTVAHTKAGLYKEEEMTILYKITQQASKAVTSLQEVIKTEQQKLNAMVESLADGVIMTDKDYRVLVANPAIKKALGLEDKKGIDIFDLIDKLGGKFDIRGKLEKSVKLNKLLTVDDALINDRFFKILVSPVKIGEGLKKGAILGGVVLFQDITHEKELEKIKEEFTSMIVHELRSPLTNIRANSDVLIRRLKQLNQNQIITSLSLLNNSSSNMLNLINDLLDVAKIEAGKLTIERKPEDLKQLINEVDQEFQSRAKEKSLRLSSLVDAQIALFPFDRLRLKQVLDNLVSNAIKYTNHGEVVISAKPFESQILVSVSDTGIGIPPEEQNMLFSKFHQLKTGISEEKGTGLGLVITKGIVESHQGKIWVKSTPGKGSVFYFTLPKS